MTAKKPAAKKAKELYTVKALIGGRPFESKAETVASALSLLSVRNVPKVKGVITVSKGGVSRTRVFPPFVIQRLFSPSPLTREIALKQTSMLYEGL